MNIAARLCDRAVDGQILLSQRAYVDLELMVNAEPLGAFELKGVRNEVAIYSVLGFKDDTVPPAPAATIGANIMCMIEGKAARARPARSSVAA